jgi:putative YhdH/YhfP family quinone oxidoreductase
MVESSDGGKPKFVGTEHTLKTSETFPSPPEDYVFIQVTHSSLNYKDALSASGNKGVTRNFPHTPGIDAAGVRCDNMVPCVVTGYDLGMNTSGGFGTLICVPQSWIVDPNPFLVEGLDAEIASKIAMVYGTAGLTAGLCVQKLLVQGQAKPSDGKVCVTGASGSVGSVAVEILAKLGFEVVAVSGKSMLSSQLIRLGAKTVVGRDALAESPKPLLKPEYAHAVDTVGGAPLAELLKRVANGGSVACCGNAAGLDLPTSVLPFILRGINLLGVDSVEISLDEKKHVWSKLASEWRCPEVESLAKVIGRDALDSSLKAYLKGQSSGKVVLDHSIATSSSSKL